jgi:diguanylate cyclase (GGDEF)-like protein
VAAPRPSSPPAAHVLVAWAAAAATVLATALSVVLAVPVPAWAPVAVAVVAGVGVFRAYDALLVRHRALQQLYDYRPPAAALSEDDGVIRHVLVQAKQLLRAERAELLWVAVGTSGPAVRTVLDADDRLVRTEEQPQPGEPPAESLLARSATLLPRDVTAAEARRYLEFHGLRDAVVVPLPVSDGVAGMIVAADRPVHVSTFDASDVALLETVAGHATAALSTERALDTLRYDARHDTLTGLPNRADGEREVGERFSTCGLGDIAGFGLLVVELSGFKELNDSLGHAHGDTLLREIAGRLQGGAGDGAFVARRNGVGFTVVLPVSRDQHAAVARGLELQAAIKAPVHLDGLEVEVESAVGVAWAPDHAQDVAGLFTCAERAMSDAKAAGNGVRLYGADTLDHVAATGTPGLAEDLRRAVERDELTVYVQPKARLDSGRVQCVEALVRWNHPTKGLLLPGDFLPVAERAGLLGALSSSMLRLSVAAVAKWQSAGIEVAVAVNLSGRELTDPGLVDEVTTLCRRSGVAPALLTLEVTEASVMADPERSVAVLGQLRDVGVRLAVDDFGTGYSSLSYLKRLPVHEVKIDKGFVMAMGTDPDAATVVRSIVDLGRNLSLEVVAEGVEDEPTWQELARLGCTSAQGYHLSRPMPANDLLGWLTAYSPQGPLRSVPRPRGPLILRRSA